MNTSQRSLPLVLSKTTVGERSEVFLNMTLLTANLFGLPPHARRSKTPGTLRYAFQTFQLGNRLI